jgi:3',5'-cyclic AMP phosphodiesterase CpdA
MLRAQFQSVDQNSFVYIANNQHFIALIKALDMPVYVIPGNHDNPQIMSVTFADTAYFPASDATFQYGIEDLPFRILALNSLCDGTDLPEFDEQRLSWLQHQLSRSDRPVLITLHHPPMRTGIELIDMGGAEWYQGLRSVLAVHSHRKIPQKIRKVLQLNNSCAKR